jgi:hypothetical protein
MIGRYQFGELTAFVEVNTAPTERTTERQVVSSERGGERP